MRCIHMNMSGSLPLDPETILSSFGRKHVSELNGKENQGELFSIGFT